MKKLLSLLLLIPSLSLGDTNNSLNSKNLKNNYYLSCTTQYDDYDFELILFVGNEYAQMVSIYAIPNKLTKDNLNYMQEFGLDDLIPGYLEENNLNEPEKDFFISSNHKEIVLESGQKIKINRYQESITFSSDVEIYHCINIGDDISEMKTFFCGTDVNFRIKRLNGDIFYSLATYGNIFEWENIFDRTKDTPFVMVEYFADNKFRFDTIEPISNKKKTSIYDYSTGENSYDNKNYSDCWVKSF